MNFICRKCGGLLLGGHPATELKQCSCHAHDGNLDEAGLARVEWEDPYINLWQCGLGEVLSLTPRQFLSLMEWGAQNREKLEHLTQEEGAK